HGAVHDFAADLYFEIARLRRRNLMIDHDDISPAGLWIGSGSRRLFRPGRPTLGRLPNASGCQGGVGFGLTFHEPAHLLPLTYPKIADPVESDALLRERAHDFEAQRLTQAAQFVQ